MARRCMIVLPQSLPLHCTQEFSKLLGARGLQMHADIQSAQSGRIAATSHCGKKVSSIARARAVTPLWLLELLSAHNRRIRGTGFAHADIPALLFCQLHCVRDVTLTFNFCWTRSCLKPVPTLVLCAASETGD